MAGAQDVAGQLPEVKVTTEAVSDTVPSGFAAEEVTIGPLGSRKILDAPFSVNVVSREMIENQQATSLSDLLRYLPSTQMEARGGMDVGRPQSRGMQGSVVANSQMDDLNIAATTAYPMEMLERVEVINGLTGPLYGPANPAGNFNFILKRPTATPLRNLTLGYRSRGAATVSADLGGTVGESGVLGYRINLLREGGEGYVSGSDIQRRLASLALDLKLSPDTVLELNASTYRFDKYGFPGTFSYGINTQLPDAPDPTRAGFGQRYTGMELETNSGSARLRHRFSNGWTLEAGYGRQIVDRYLRSLTNAVQADGETLVVSANSNYPGRFIVDSNLLRLRGSVKTGTIGHELSFSSTGYNWEAYSARTPNTQYPLGVSSFSRPRVFPSPGRFARTGGVSFTSRTRVQSFTVGDTITFNPRWSAMLLGSYATLEASGYDQSGWSGTASLSYKPARNTTVYAAYADTLQEGGMAGANTANEGESLAPIRSKQYELGLRHAISGGPTIGVTLFDLQRPFAFTGADNYYRVQGLQRNRGLELSAQGDIGARWSIYGGVTLLDAKLKDTPNAATANKPVVGVPTVQASLLAQYRVAQAPGLVLTGGVHYTGKRSINTTDTASVDGYYTLDLGARYTTRVANRRTTWRLALNNITDQRYWVSVFPGNINGTLASGSAFLGDPREIRASVTVEF